MISVKDRGASPWPSGYKPGKTSLALTSHFPGPQRSLRVPRTAPSRRDRREQDRMAATSQGSHTLELGSPENSQQTMQPVWKRHSQEQRLSKVPEQEAIPQHGDDIEVRKIPARLNQLGSDQSRSAWKHDARIQFVGSLTSFPPSQGIVLFFNRT